MQFQRFASLAGLSLMVLGGAACTPPPPEEPMLTDTVWELQQIQYNNDTLLEANPPENYTVEFMTDGSLAVKADCNTGRGTYSTTEDRQISVGEIALTRAACPPESISNEFVQGLSDAAIYFFQEGDLYIDIKYGTGTMHFEAAGD